MTTGQTFTIDGGYGLVPILYDKAGPLTGPSVTFDVTVADGTHSSPQTVTLYEQPYISTIDGTSTLTVAQGATGRIDIQATDIEGDDLAGATLDVTTAATDVTVPSNVTVGSRGTATIDVQIGNTPTGTHSIVVTDPADGETHTATLTVTPTTGDVTVDTVTDVTQGTSDGTATVTATDLAGDPHVGVTVTATADPDDVRATGRCVTDAAGQCTLTLEADLDADTTTAHTLTATTANATSAPSTSFSVLPTPRAATIVPAAITGAPGQNIPVNVEVADGAGNTMSGASVTVTSGDAAYTLDDGTLNGQSSFTTTTDGFGQLAFTVELVGSGGTYTGTEGLSVQVGAVDRTLPVRIVPDAASATIAPATVPAGSDTLVRVTVSDASSNPVADYPFRTTVTPDDGGLTAGPTGPTGASGAGTTLLSAATDATGSYTVEVTDAAGTTTLGSATLTVASNDQRVTLSGTAREGQTSAVTVTATRGQARTPTGNAPVGSVQVVDVDGAPVTGASAAGPAQTDPDGTATISIDLPTGITDPVLLLDVTVDGTSYLLPVDVAAGSRRIDAGDVTVAEGERRRVAVRVTNTAGRPSSGVPIVAESDTTNVTVTGGVTDSRGVAPVTVDVPAGTVTVGTRVTVTITGGAATGTFVATVGPSIRPDNITLGTAAIGTPVEQAGVQLVPVGGTLTIDVCAATTGGVAAPTGTSVTAHVDADLRLSPAATRLDGTGCATITIAADAPLPEPTEVRLTVGGTTVTLPVDTS